MNKMLTLYERFRIRSTPGYRRAKRLKKIFTILISPLLIALYFPLVTIFVLIHLIWDLMEMLYIPRHVIDYIRVIVETKVKKVFDDGVKHRHSNDEKSWTPLMHAAMFDQNPEVIITLLNEGADVNEVSSRGWTLLMYAATLNPNPEIIMTLLKAGAEVNFQNKYGLTALMLAANNNFNPEVITTLLKAGADGKLRSKLGKTAYGYAKKNKNVRDTAAYQELKAARFKGRWK